MRPVRMMVSLGNGRYELLEQLGEGSFGTVYAAVDTQRGDRVAVKVLRRTSASALYHFKQEFRSLAEISHPHLVGLYELGRSEDDTWFLVMELVDGPDLLTYLGSDDERASSDSAKGLFGDRGELDTARTSKQRLRTAFAQLCAGVSALHDAGKMHRDIKPSNILVDHSGRVVVVDFGLVKELTRDCALDEQGIGSVAYMAPEQAVGDPIGEAADWYSVGSVLYEALTGRRPFSGARLDVLVDKQSKLPTPPGRLAPGAPPDLCDLCLRMLSPDPSQRPHRSEIFEKFMAGAAMLRAVSIPSWTPKEEPFVGRMAELNLLEKAMADARGGETVTVFVHGPSGIGKTALIRRFRDHVMAQPDALFFQGRCFEGDNTPYKAFDMLVDALCDHLASLEEGALEALRPADLSALATLFPVLERLCVPGVDAERSQPSGRDPQEVRRRAFEALRELLSRMAQSGPLVLAIDNAQWGDLDSAMLLQQVLRPPNPPSLLFVATYRSEHEDSSPFLKVALSAAGSGRIRHVQLQPLAEEEVQTLVAVLVARDDADRLVASVARESGGSPYFIRELARHLSRPERTQNSPLPTEARLEAMLVERLEELSEAARRTLQVIAVASRPTIESVVAKAAGIEGEQRSLFTQLRKAQLIQSVGGDCVECYHDCIRETVVRSLGSAVRCAHHRALAVALETSPEPDPEWLSLHYEAAGERTKAGFYVGQAARRATEVLAFDRAAALYRRTLDLLQPPEHEARQYKVGLANSLALAGHGYEAARAYLDLAQGARAAEAIESQRLASQQFLISGHIDEGLALAARIAPAVGIQVPSTRKRMLLSLVLQRARLRLRGLHFVERQSSALPGDAVQRVDALLAIGMGLGNIDPIRTALFHSHCVSLALELGEPTRVLRALNGEVMLAACAGRGNYRRTTKLLATLSALADRLGRADSEDTRRQAWGIHALASGFADQFTWGRSRNALEHFDRAAQIFAESPGRSWSVDQAQLYALEALYRLGELAEIKRRVENQMRRAQEQGNRLIQTSLRTGVGHVAWLVDDRPQDLEAAVDQVMSKWSRAGVHVQHLWEARTRADIKLYQGDAAAAARGFETRWPTLVRAQLLRVQSLLIDMLYLRGRLALATGRRAQDRQRSVRLANRCADRIEGQHVPYGDPLAKLLRGGVAALERNMTKACEQLAHAEAGFRQADMRLFEAVSAYRRGEILGGEKGANLKTGALAFFAAQQVRVPERLVAMLASECAS